MHNVTVLYPATCGQMTLEQAAWEILHLDDCLEEIRIHANQKSLDIILGSGLLGRFVYIPSQRFGFPAEDLKNTSHSQECLLQIFDEQRAATIACVLHHYVTH